MADNWQKYIPGSAAGGGGSGGGSGGSGGGGGGGYSGALSFSDSGTQGVQLGATTVNNQSGFQLPGWAAPVLIVAVFAVVIVGLIIFAPKN